MGNAEENVKLSSINSAAHGSRKEQIIAKSQSLRRRQIDKMQLEALRATKETEQRLLEQQSKMEQEREEIELRRGKKELQQQQEELRLKLQQQEDKLLLRQHERALERPRARAAGNYTDKKEN